MNKSLRKPVIAGNFKMNKTPSEAKNLIKELIPLVNKAECEVVICVPFVDLSVALEECDNTNIKVGAQNCHFEKSGAYTGEVSAHMLSDMGVEYVIIGHSERRAYFNETDITVNKKIRAALDEGLKVILCVGESLEQREQGIMQEIIRMQVKAALNGVRDSELDKIIIAYEPIWAIGTGKTATSEQADEVCFLIRQLIGELYNESLMDSVIIQYGGSMNAKNAKELLQKPNVDGGLIGGASLKAVDFSSIVKDAD